MTSTEAEEWLKNFPRMVALSSPEIGVLSSERKGLGDDGSCDCAVGHPMKIVTWNVLANPYAVSESFPKVDPGVLGSEFRFPRIATVLRSLLSSNAHILALQEVSNFEGSFKPVLDELGMEFIYTKRPTKLDGCVLAWKRDRWTQTRSPRIISFDELVPSGMARLQRHNVGIVTTLSSTCERCGRRQRLVVGTVHLFWNPQREDVKLLQMAELLRVTRLEIETETALLVSRPPDYIVLGDFNSTEVGIAYQLATQGKATYIPQAMKGVQKKMPRFIADFSLNRVCRYLRLLGIDCTLETDAEHNARCDITNRGGTAIRMKEGKRRISPIISRAEIEKRTLLTTSKTLICRKECAALEYLVVDPRLGPHVNVISICREQGIEPAEDDLLSRCVRCNGDILEIKKDDVEGRVRLKECGIVPPNILAGIVFQCVSCLQPYWWDDGERSGSARALRYAKHLAAAVMAPPDEEDSEMLEVVKEGMNLELEPDQNDKCSLGVDSKNYDNRFELAHQLLRGEALSHSLKLFDSSLAHRASNLTVGFQGRLDHIFASESLFVKSEAELPWIPDPYLPNEFFPSDHLPIVIEFGRVLLSHPCYRSACFTLFQGVLDAIMQSLLEGSRLIFSPVSQMPDDDGGYLLSCMSQGCCDAGIASTSNVNCGNVGNDDRQTNEDCPPKEPKYGSFANLAAFNFKSMSWILREEDVDARNLYITAANGDVSAAKNLVMGNRLRVKHIRSMLQTSLPLPSKLILHVSTFLLPAEVNSLSNASATMKQILEVKGTSRERKKIYRRIDTKQEFAKGYRLSTSLTNLQAGGGAQNEIDRSQKPAAVPNWCYSGVSLTTWIFVLAAAVVTTLLLLAVL